MGWDICETWQINHSDLLSSLAFKTQGSKGIKTDVNAPGQRESQKYFWFDRAEKAAGQVPQGDTNEM